MSGIEWFRSWHGAPTDSKWLVIARRAKVEPGIVSAVVWALLDHASQQVDRGSIAAFDAETYSAWSGLTEEHVVAVIRELEGKGVIAEGRFAEWEKRQPRRERDDAATSTDRVRRMRERKRHETPRNASPGQPEPPMTSDGQGTPSDKESESEKKEIQEPRDARAASLPEEPKPRSFQKIVDEEFEERFWPAWPNKVGKPKARVAYFVARKRADVDQIMAGLDRYVTGKPADRPWLNPTTFLNQDRFDDQPAPVAPGREPRHNPMLRALAEMAADSPDDDRRANGPHRIAFGGGEGGGGGGDFDVEAQDDV